MSVIFLKRVAQYIVIYIFEISQKPKMHLFVTIIYTFYEDQAIIKAPLSLMPIIIYMLCHKENIQYVLCVH